MTVKIILQCIAITLFIVSPDCEGLRGDSSAICRTTVSRRLSRYVPYIETYRQTVFFGFRVRTRTNYKKEYHTVWTTEAVCCDGYQNIGGYCEPVCSDPCTNGKCVKRNVCECNRGYVLNYSGNECIPVCASPCDFGKCTAPETCTCNEGYQFNANKYTCEPTCSSTCDNGYCAKPNICGCNPGYKINDANKCDPICERQCINGKCVAPDICTCNDGFQSSQDDDFTCEPKCREPCVFGTCTAPDICTCEKGYEMNNGSNFTCTSVCSETCVFGNCILPDTCSCNDGYVLTEKSKYICEPLCDEECVHGNCVAPNVCECLDGYVKSIGIASNRTRCEPYCNGSCTNGVCTAPDTCICNSGFRYNLTTMDCDPVCTDPCINGICESPETCVCLKGYAKSSSNINTCEAVCENCTNGLCKAPDECICNEGFIRDEIDNKTCVNSCNPKCVNGACSAMGCTCDFGWGGNSCGESLLCFVSKRFQDWLLDVESDTISEFRDLKGTKNVAENFQTKLDRPACNPRCLSEVDSSTISINKTLRNEIVYLFPVDSPCNIAVAQAMISKTYVSMIGVIIGAVLCTLVVYSVYIIRIKKNLKSEINSGSRECVYTKEVEEPGLTDLCFDNIQSL